MAAEKPLDMSTTEVRPRYVVTSLQNWGWKKILLAACIGPVVLVLALLAVLETGPGKRLVADYITHRNFESGLKVKVSRIEGSVFGSAVLHDVTFSDLKGEFAQTPELRLSWRPLALLRGGLDIRNVQASRGQIMRIPNLRPGDPNDPILPDYDIAIDKVQIDGIALGSHGPKGQTERLHFRGKLDYQDRNLTVYAAGNVGGNDQFFADIRSIPADNQFRANAGYDIAAGGALARLLGTKTSHHLSLQGDGNWREWHGLMTARRADKVVSHLTLTHTSGKFNAIGTVNIKGMVHPSLSDALGNIFHVKLDGQFAEQQELGMRFAIDGPNISATGKGVLDVTAARLNAFDAKIRQTKAIRVGDQVKIEGGRLDLSGSGRLGRLAFNHTFDIANAQYGAVRIAGLHQRGVIRRQGRDWHVPVNLVLGDIISGSSRIDRIFDDTKLNGSVAFVGNTISAPKLIANFQGGGAQLALLGDRVRSEYSVRGPVTINAQPTSDLALDMGPVSARALVDMSYRGGAKLIAAQFQLRADKLPGGAMEQIFGRRLAISGDVNLVPEGGVSLRDSRLVSPKLSAEISARQLGAVLSLAAQGRHPVAGKFLAAVDFSNASAKGKITLASPLESLGLKNVQLDFAPQNKSYLVNTQGQSHAGAFRGGFTLDPKTSDIANIDLRIGLGRLTGDLRYASGLNGTLTASGPGIDGKMRFSSLGQAQNFAANLEANNVRWGSDNAMAIAHARFDGSGILPSWGAHSTPELAVNIVAEGVSAGALFLGRVAARADIKDSQGKMLVSLAGRRSSRFSAQIKADISRNLAQISATGSYDGKALRLARGAQVAIAEDGALELKPAIVTYGKGGVVVAGRLHAQDAYVSLKMKELPLTLLDGVSANLGLGGTVSGVAEYRRNALGPPEGSAKIAINRLSRSGTFFTSPELTVLSHARLNRDELQADVSVARGGKQLGNMTAQIAQLPPSGGLRDRLWQGQLAAKLRYGGPADALWRFLGLNGFDITGPIGVVAQAKGTLANPAVTGAISGQNLGLTAPVIGLNVQHVKLRGAFEQSRLQLREFSGETIRGGRVSGSGVVILEDLSNRRPQLDIRIAAKSAPLVNASGLEAVVSGPLRITSDGYNGIIAGRLVSKETRWQLGQADRKTIAAPVPVREINRPIDWEEPPVPRIIWRYLVDIAAPNRLDVKGQGIDSEWSANLKLRGTTGDPRLGGTADMITGSYAFAGSKFDLERGRMIFDLGGPINPRLDIVARSVQSNLDVSVFVQGTALKPDVRFTSTPALPEEEILARLLFGGSITQLSATDALQLGTALTALQGGADLDPINKLRGAIGLDRLRIVSADPALGRSTGIALGKRFGRRTYVELVTDGRGYSATSLEFRITRWLALLASVSTIGRESVLLEVSRDY